MSEPNLALPRKAPPESSVVRGPTRKRLPGSPLASCLIPPLGELQWAKARGLSASGLQLVMSRELKPETDLLVQIRSQKGPAVHALAARVVGSRLHYSGNWIVDCAFPKQLGDEELRDLIQEPG